MLAGDPRSQTVFTVAHRGVCAAGHGQSAGTVLRARTSGSHAAHARRAPDQSRFSFASMQGQMFITLGLEHTCA